MKLSLMRHAATASNEQHRYVGKRTDEPLSEQGCAQCLQAGTHPEVSVVYTSPLLRARQTASLCFPNARVVPVPGLEEIDFGAFEGRTANEMADDEAYRAWVDGWCVGTCPGGESRQGFVARSNDALVRLLQDAHQRGEQQVIVVAHAGTIMAALSELGPAVDGEDNYFCWQVGSCEGYRATVRFEGNEVLLGDPSRV